ncbi:sugar phosphate isomerase/epimerase family protein [Acinetobacter populi]|nr:sugar phosphate isomerase/epimerase [Acinetobacter populi]
MSIQPQEIKKIMAEEKIKITDIKKIAADYGVTITRLDPLCTWVPKWETKNFGSSFNDGHSTTPQEFFEIATALEVQIMSLNATFPEGTYSTEQLSEFFYTIDSMANDHGILCGLEAIPMWGVKTIAQAWDIVNGSGSKMGGIVIDTLHFVRGNSTLEMLDKIPSNRFHNIQICDGPLNLPENKTLEDECFSRMWPGDGEFPLIEILKYLKERKVLREVCAEVFSYTNKNKSLEEIATLSREKVENLFTKAGISYSDLQSNLTIKNFNQ